MFSQVCQKFCPRGVYPGRHPPADTLWANTLPTGKTPSTMDTPRADTSPQIVTEVGGTHPTGKHSCLSC